MNLLELENIDTMQGAPLPHINSFDDLLAFCDAHSLTLTNTRMIVKHGNDDDYTAYLQYEFDELERTDKGIKFISAGDLENSCLDIHGELASAAIRVIEPSELFFDFLVTLQNGLSIELSAWDFTIDRDSED